MQEIPEEITTMQLLSLLNKESVKIIDVRSVDAYNGWKQNSEQRGGHIKGAKSLPFKWTSYLDWTEMVDLKDIKLSNQLVIYGDNPIEIKQVASLFKKLGYSNIFTYYGFSVEWINDLSLPIENLSRFKHLVPAKWVKKLIDGEEIEHFDGGKYIIVHAHYRNRDAYLSGHIPGAIDMDTLALESPETWNRREPDELKIALEEHGITADTKVILYGKYMDPDNNDPFPGSAAGDIGAIRCAFIMMYAGVKDVRVLNGGFQSWIDEGYNVDYTDEPKIKAEDFGRIIPALPELAVDTPEAKEMISSKDAELVCVRSWPEYIGEVSGYNYIEKKGRIPGAVFADCGSDAYHMENYRNFDHTTREYHEIERIWIQQGITPEKKLAFYCGTGWRGSEAWFNAWLMGWNNISVYDGGWFEWSSDPENPIGTGIPEGYDEDGKKKSLTQIKWKEDGLSNFLVEEDMNEVSKEILNGLTSERKYISSRFFYDDKGSSYFEAITKLPEYYLSRIEKKIIKDNALKIINGRENVDIIELGSGDCSKISLLLDPVKEKIETFRYIPVDVSEQAILKSREVLSRKYPRLRIHGLLGDFLKHLKSLPGDGTRLVCFFGSTIGNLSKELAGQFLIDLKKLLNRGDFLILGVDMVKDHEVIKAAYNDKEGVTAAFNKNILNVVNGYLDAEFDTKLFDHIAVYNKVYNRIEMYLKATKNMVVRSNKFGEIISLKKGEVIHTENSHKFTSEDISNMADHGGYQIDNIYTDNKQWFSLVKLVANS